jgi:transposase
VFDRGFVSDENLKCFESEEIKYITAMDRNQIESICEEQFEFNQFGQLNCDDITEFLKNSKLFSKIDKTKFCREIKIKGKRRYILCFNPQLFLDQRDSRDEGLDVFINETLPEMNEELNSAQKSRSYSATMNKFTTVMKKLKIASFTDIELTEKTVNEKTTTFQATVNIDQTKKFEAQRFDGFWLLVTNHIEKDTGEQFILPTADALRPYADKIIIEDAFRHMKAILEMAPLYVRLEDHVNAHYTICVLGQLIDRTIHMRLQKEKGQLSSDILTAEAVYEELSDCSIDEILVRNIKQRIFCLTELNEKRKEVLMRLGLGKLSRIEKLLTKMKAEANSCS